MKLKINKTRKTLLIILLIGTFSVALITIQHPILTKWIAGSARIVGRPMNVTVYTDEQVNTTIKTFHVERNWDESSADYYLIYASTLTPCGLNVFRLNRKQNHAELPSSSNVRDYDIIAGFLFQSEVGSHFTPFEDDIKGFNFDPQLIFNDHQIMLNIPSSRCDHTYSRIKVDLSYKSL